MTVLYDDTYVVWEECIEPRWIHGSDFVSPAGGTKILHIRVSDGYIYGFVIESECDNNFRLVWKSNGTKYSIIISLPSPGTVQYSSIVPINEGLPATGDVYISTVNDGSGKCRASILVSSTSPILQPTPNWFVTTACVAKMDPLYPIKSKAALKTCTHEYGKSNILTGRLLWSYRLAENTWIASCCSADIDDDGNVEIIVPPGRYGRYVYCLNGKDGSVKWLYDTGQSNYWETIHVAAHDIDMDGKMEIIVWAYGDRYGRGQKIHCIAHNGTVKWTYTPPYAGWSTVAPVCIYDIDNDGKLEVITGGFFSRAGGNVVISIFSSNGTIKKSWEVPPPATYPAGSGDVGIGVKALTGLAVADIDGDGEAEIVAGTIYQRAAWYYYYNVPWVVCFTKDGNVKWGNYIYTTPGDIVRFVIPISLFDVDGDGGIEVLSYRASYEPDGKCNTTLGGYPECVAYGVYDIDGNGVVECIGAEDLNMYCIDTRNGSLKWVYIIPVVGGMCTPGCLADIDSDGKYEVLFHNEEAVIYCLGHDGKLKWSYSGEKLYEGELRVVLNYSVKPMWKCDLIDDVNGDDMLEVVAPVGASYRVYVFGSD
jgi:hypothetical protein